jgi:hypothetical protein
VVSVTFIQKVFGQLLHVMTDPPWRMLFPVHSWSAVNARKTGAT